MSVCLCVSAMVRLASCRYVRVLADDSPSCSSGRQAAADWQLTFSEKLANVRFGYMNMANDANGLNSFYFPNCSAALFHDEGICTVTHIANAVCQLVRNLCRVRSGHGSWVTFLCVAYTLNFAVFNVDGLGFVLLSSQTTSAYWLCGVECWYLRSRGRGFEPHPQLLCTN